MKKVIVLIILLSIVTSGQQVIIQIDNLSSDKVTLHSLEGETKYFVDSLEAHNGILEFSISEKHTGLYRIKLNGNTFLDFVYDGGEINISTDAFDLFDSFKVIKSRSNKLFYKFKRLNSEFKTKSELLQLILARYPSEDAYYSTTETTLQELQKKYLEFVNVTSQTDSNSFIARYIQSSQLPILNFTSPVDEQLSYLKSHSLDNVDFSDARLIYSDCFTNKSIEYLTYYQNPQLPKELLEKEFTKAVDTLLNKASVNILVYQHIADYLIDGFKQFGFNNVVDYIVENYVVKDDLCLDELTENSIENRINQSKLLKIGTTAPNVVLPDTAGNLIDISAIDKENILLLFYASWCPHCQEILPEIHKFYKQRNDLKVIAISLDEDKTDWVDYLKANKFDWINLSDLKGWNSKVAKDYYIYATPTMFMLDENRAIIGKPLKVIELRNILNK